MKGAIEFLRKAKAIDNPSDKEDVIITLINYLHDNYNINEAELVSKVMAYPIKEDADEQE